jgi:hypothetical protein
MADGVNSDFSSALNQNPISEAADSTGLHPVTAEPALRREFTSTGVVYGIDPLRFALSR